MLKDPSQPGKPTPPGPVVVDPRPAPVAGSAPVPAGPRRRFPTWVRFGIPVAILIMGTTFESLAWFRNAGDATWQVMLTWYIVPPCAFLLLLWWVFLSGFAWKLRLAVVGVGAATVAGFFTFYRFKEFSGDMVPRFESRWQESAEQKADDYWKSQKIATTSRKRDEADAGRRLSGQAGRLGPV